MGIASHAAEEESNNLSGSIGVEESSIICVRPRGNEYEIFSLQEETSENDSASFHLSHQRAAHVPKSLLDKFLVIEAPDHLRGGTQQKVHLVVSTRSGTGRALDFYKSVLQPLLGSLGLFPSSSDVPGSDGSFHLVVTRDAQSIREFAASLPSELEHTVVLVSGDGGIVESLNGKADRPSGPTSTSMSRPPLPLIAMLPLGTGNALFNSLHKGVYAACGSSAPSPLVLGLRTLLRGRRAPLPSFRVDFSPGSRQISYKDAPAAATSPSQPSVGVEEQLSPVTHLYGAIVASYGFHSQLVWESDTPEYRKHGAKRFGMVAAELLKESHAYHARVETRGLLPSGGQPPPQQQQQQLLENRQRHAYVLATLVSNLERTFTISPASRPLDGVLRLVHFGPVGGERTMDIMKQAYNDGQHVNMTWTTTTTTSDGEEDGSSNSSSAREEGVGYEQVGEVLVVTHEEDARWRKVCIDGTIVELPPGGSMTVKTESTPHLDILVDPSIVVTPPTTAAASS